MAKNCVNCGNELPDDVDVCPNCGSDVDVNSTSEVSDEISRMFTETNSANAASDEKIVVNSGNLNAEQLEAFSSGKPLEFAPKTSSPSRPKQEDDELKKIDELEQQALLDAISGGQTPPEDGSDLPESLVDLAEVGEAIAEFADEENILIQAGVKEVTGFKIPEPVKKFGLLVFCSVVAFCFGFGVCSFINRDTYASKINDIGYSALKGVLMKIPEESEFKAYDIFIKRDSNYIECIIFGAIYSEINDYSSTYYRLLLNDDFSDVTLYKPFNRDEYEQLKSGSDEDRVRASVMMNYYENFLRSVGEINSGNTRWSRADTDYINLQILKDKTK